MLIEKPEYLSTIRHFPPKQFFNSIIQCVNN